MRRQKAWYSHIKILLANSKMTLFWGLISQSHKHENRIRQQYLNVVLPVPSGTVVFSYQTLTEADKAFSPENNIFETPEERLKAHDIAHRFGSALYKNNPLGWEDSQALVVFPENVPNNTLPIFYAEGVEYNGRPWRALFPRA